MNEWRNESNLINCEWLPLFFHPMPSCTLPVCRFNCHMNLLLLPKGVSWDGNVNLLDQSCVNTALIKCSYVPLHDYLWPDLAPVCYLSQVLRPFINFTWATWSRSPPVLSHLDDCPPKSPACHLGPQSLTRPLRPRSLAGPALQPSPPLSWTGALLPPPILCPHSSLHSTEYRWPLNSTGLNCAGPLKRGFFSISIVNVLCYDFSNIFFSLADFLVKIQYMTHITHTNYV